MLLSGIVWYQWEMWAKVERENEAIEDFSSFLIRKEVTVFLWKRRKVWNKQKMQGMDVVAAWGGDDIDVVIASYIWRMKASD